MAPRRPPGQSWESFVDRQIREAQERGDFDHLSGRGRPIPDLEDSRGPDWWIRRKLKQENFDALPPALKLRREVEKAREEIARAGTEDEVRRILAVINERIRYTNRTIVVGPPSTVMPLDEERTLRAWRQSRGEDA